MEKVTLSKKEYEQMIGLLSFDNDATEEFTPSIFLGLDKRLQPTFTIRPFKTNERNEYQKIILNTQKHNVNDAKYNDKMFLETRKLTKLVANCILKVENFLKKTKDGDIEVQEFNFIDGHIDDNDLEKLSELVKRSVLDRVNIISGLDRNTQVAL